MTAAEQTPTESEPKAPSRPVVQVAPDVDTMPAPEALAQMPADQRAAIYLNSIRKMLAFFVLLTVIGIIAGVIIGIVDINAVHQANQGVSSGF